MPPPPDEPKKTVFDDESVRALAEQQRIRKGTVPDLEMLAARLRAAETWYFSDRRGARSWRVLGLPPDKIRNNMRVLASRLHNAVGGLNTDEAKRLLAIMHLIQRVIRARHKSLLTEIKQQFWSTQPTPDTEVAPPQATPEENPEK